MTLSTITTPFWEDPRFMARYGEAIRERREYVGFTTATSCANESIRLEREDPLSFKRFSQSSLSRWELDKTGEFIEGAHSRSLRRLGLGRRVKPRSGRGFGGAPARIRTLDLLIRSPMMRCAWLLVVAACAFWARFGLLVCGWLVVVAGLATGIATGTLERSEP